MNATTTLSINVRVMADELGEVSTESRAAFIEMLEAAIRAEYPTADVQIEDSGDMGYNGAPKVYGAEDYRDEESIISRIGQIGETTFNSGEWYRGADAE